MTLPEAQKPGISRSSGATIQAHQPTVPSVIFPSPQARATEPATPPSLIETMRVEPGGLMPLIEGHLQRLRQSCEALGYRWPGEATLHDQVARAADELDPSAWWRLRLLLAPDGGTSLEAGPLAPPHPPLRVAVHGPRMSGAADWLRHKTTHRPWYEDATRWLAAHPDVFDVLYWNENGEMCEGSRSNLYMQTAGGGWLTPPLEAGALPGVQRQALLNAGLVEEARIHRNDFLLAPALRISNALRGWQDVLITHKS